MHEQKLLSMRRDKRNLRFSLRQQSVVDLAGGSQGPAGQLEGVEDKTEQGLAGCKNQPLRLLASAQPLTPSGTASTGHLLFFHPNNPPATTGRCIRHLSSANY